MFLYNVLFPYVIWRPSLTGLADLVEINFLTSVDVWSPGAAASRKAYRQSDKSKAYQKTYQKVYRQSDKGRAARKAYEQSDKGKASRKAYEQSKRRKAYQRDYQKDYQKAYEQSEKRKAYLKAYQKAYYEVFNKTGDREQAKIAGKQATAFMRKSNKSRNSELESITVSPITPRLSSWLDSQ